MNIRCLFSHGFVYHVHPTQVYSLPACKEYLPFRTCVRCRHQEIYDNDKAAWLSVDRNVSIQQYWEKACIDIDKLTSSIVTVINGLDDYDLDLFMHRAEDGQGQSDCFTVEQSGVDKIRAAIIEYTKS